MLFVYNLSDKNSFEELEMWYELYKKQKRKVIGVLIGNKSDIKREVDYEKAKSFADEHELEYFESSAKLDKKIKKAIVCLLTKYIESKALYNSLDSIDSQNNNERIIISPEKFTEESCWKRFCKNLNPFNWFK